MLSLIRVNTKSALSLKLALSSILLIACATRSAAQGGQYGQAAGAALDQGGPAYGQAAGAALDQGGPAYGAPPNPGPPGGGAVVPPQINQPGLPFSSVSPSNPPGMPGPFNHDCIDLTTAVLSHFEMNLQDAVLVNASVDKLHVTVNNLDMKNGTLAGLTIAVKGGQFSDVAFDELNITTQGNMNFDRNQMLSDRVLAFQSPVQAQVVAVVSQDSLNRFLNAPATLQRLSGQAQEKVKFLASMLGSNANIGITLSDATVALEKSNHVNIGFKAKLGMGSLGVPLPLAIDTKLGLNQDGWISLSDTHLVSNGEEVSPLLSNMIMKKFDEMSSWGKKNDDIHFSFSKLKVVPGKQFVVEGTAEIARLRFGHTP